MCTTLHVIKSKIWKETMGMKYATGLSYYISLICCRHCTTESYKTHSNTTPSSSGSSNLIPMQNRTKPAELIRISERHKSFCILGSSNYQLGYPLRDNNERVNCELNLLS